MANEKQLEERLQSIQQTLILLAQKHSLQNAILFFRDTNGQAVVYINAKGADDQIYTEVRNLLTQLLEDIYNKKPDIEKSFIIKNKNN